MDAGALLPLGLLQHDELADVGLHEEEEVQQNRREEGGEHGPNLEALISQTSGRDEPASLCTVGHLN